MCGHVDEDLRDLGQLSAQSQIDLVHRRSEFVRVHARDRMHLCREKHFVRCDVNCVELADLIHRRGARERSSGELEPRRKDRPADQEIGERSGQADGSQAQ